MPIDTQNFRLNIGAQPTGDEVFQSKRFLRKAEGNQSGPTFADMIKGAINSVDEASKTAEQQAEDVVSGKTENVHEVMISLQKAQLSFQLMLEIRNKALETYQELSRMQI
ncbi:flagellar hook-basal body complex protein FliE [bacterium]|nr:MAG: flagellar hook-basal body complex protein FliE [bacterium]